MSFFLQNRAILKNFPKKLTFLTKLLNLLIRLLIENLLTNSVGLAFRNALMVISIVHFTTNMSNVTIGLVGATVYWDFGEDSNEADDEDDKDENVLWRHY